MEAGSVGFGVLPLAYSEWEQYNAFVDGPIQIEVVTENASLPAGTTYLLSDPTTLPISLSVSFGGTLFGTTFFVCKDAIAASARFPEHTSHSFGEVVTNPITVTVTFLSEYGDRLSPVYLWPGYDSDGTSITIPLAQLPGLSVAEADAATGDWREVLQAILVSSLDHSELYIKQSLASQLDTYKIYRKNFYRSTIDSYFTVQFLTDMGVPNVAPEP